MGFFLNFAIPKVQKEPKNADFAFFYFYFLFL